MNIPHIKTKKKQILIKTLTNITLDTQLKHILNMDNILHRVCTTLLTSPKFTLTDTPINNKTDRKPPITVPNNTQFKLYNQIHIQFFKPNKTNYNTTKNLTLQTN